MILGLIAKACIVYINTLYCVVVFVLCTHTGTEIQIIVICSKKGYNNVYYKYAYFINKTSSSTTTIMPSYSKHGVFTKL